ncbi:MAG TPA: YciI family protein [Azospirillaceae bacterium]|nr:YciI family protein [Azospirillaceae bacterium]
MLYALLCFNSESVVGSWTAEEDAAVMARLDVVHRELAAEGKLGPAARLRPTAEARTLWKGGEPPLVTDGPYAETKEQMLGFYLVDCAGFEEAVAVARRLEQANPGVGAYEIRPVSLYLPGSRPADAPPAD